MTWSNQHAPEPAPRVVMVAQHNPAMWWQILAIVNGGAVVLCAILGLTSGIVGLLVGLAILVVTNAVLVPIAAVRLTARLTLDFDRRTIQTRALVLAAHDFVSIVEVISSGYGRGRQLSLNYRTGAITIQIEGFSASSASRHRDQVVAAFIAECLPAPDSYRQQLATTWKSTTTMLGKREAIARLNGDYA